MSVLLFHPKVSSSLIFSQPFSDFAEIRRASSPDHNPPQYDADAEECILLSQDRHRSEAPGCCELRIGCTWTPDDVKNDKNYSAHTIFTTHMVECHWPPDYAIATEVLSKRVGQGNPISLSACKEPPLDKKGNARKPRNQAKVLQLAVYDSPGHRLKLSQICERLRDKFDFFHEHWDDGLGKKWQVRFEFALELK